MSDIVMTHAQTLGRDPVLATFERRLARLMWDVAEKLEDCSALLDAARHDPAIDPAALCAIGDRLDRLGQTADRLLALRDVTRKALAAEREGTV